MKLIRQTRLFFQEGRSDKVYEVDLCEVRQDRFVVNFRYGRRGATLKEGTKTENVVLLAEAEKIFTTLVAEKTRKGYREATGQAAAARPQMPRAKANLIDEEARKQAILERLAKGRSAKKKTTWSLERVIWRAGELKIKEAAPLLIELIGSGNALRDYCLAWSLGFCGDSASVPALNSLYRNAKSADMVRRIAGEALLKLADEQTRGAIRDEVINSLPQELSYLARQSSTDEFARVLTEYLDSNDPARFVVLDQLYFLDTPMVRPALLNLLRTAPMRPNYFQRLRHIFKAAEYRRDAEAFGLLAYRFETSRAMFNTTYRGLDEDTRHPTWVHFGSGYGPESYVQDGRKEVQSPSSRIGYSSRTRIYLRDRVWRTLRRLGEINDPDYVKMAVGVLLPFTDADAQAVKQSYAFDDYTRTAAKTYWDAYASYWAFNHLLYRNSPRYGLRNNSRAWRCKPGYKPGDPPPSGREEAFPHLWDRTPAGLLHLLAESHCRPVIEFAARALGTLEEFCAQLDLDAVLMILDRPYQEAARLGYQLALARYHAPAPDRLLTLALANCLLEEARTAAHSWIMNARDHFLQDTDFLTALVFSSHADTRACARNLLFSAAFSEARAQAVATRFITHLQTLAASQAEIARDASDMILTCFARHLRIIEMSVIHSLLACPLLEAQELGGKLLLNHNTAVEDLPEGVMQSLIASPYESMRAIGIKLFGQLDDRSILQRDNLVAALAMHELEDVRNAIRTVIRRLCQSLEAGSPIAKQGKHFAAQLAAHFLQALREKERHEGVHATLVNILREDLGDQWMKDATRGVAWRLIQSPSPAAQELGGILMQFKTSVDASFTDDFDFTDLVELSNHEVLALRQASWAMFAKMLPRLQASSAPDEMAKAVKLLDARWDDARDHWFRVFDASFTAKEFTPALLVSICDSVRPDVQAFGRRLITRFFADEDGPEYLLKLSEHPSSELQTFATNYLERYATDNPARLAALKPYFITVLSRVNRARVAKNRILNFLIQEAKKSEASARLVAEILTRQSVTMAIGDKAATIEAMLVLHRAYPQIPMPLAVRQTEVRNAF